MLHHTSLLGAARRESRAVCRVARKATEYLAAALSRSGHQSAMGDSAAPSQANPTQPPASLPADALRPRKYGQKEERSAGATAAAMHVVHVIGTLDRGGSELFLLNTIRASHGSSLVNYLICFGEDKFDLEKDFASCGAIILRIPTAYSVLALGRLVRAVRADVIHAHTELNAAIALTVGAAMRVPLRVAHSHTTLFSVARPKTIVRRGYEITARRTIRRMANLKLACGEAAGIAMFGQSPFKVLPNGVDLSEFAFRTADRLSIREELACLGVNSETFLIGIVARLVPAKNHSFILEVLATLRSELGVHLMVVGRGPLEEKLKTQAESLGISSRVHFLGVREDVGSVLSALDVAVLPSRYEGFGLAAVEAQANGVPLIVSSVIDESVRCNENCISLPIDTSDAVTRWRDALLAVRLGSISRQSPSLALNRFDSSVSASTLIRYYVQALGNLGRLV